MTGDPWGVWDYFHAGIAASVTVIGGYAAFLHRKLWGHDRELVDQKADLRIVSERIDRSMEDHKEVWGVMRQYTADLKLELASLHKRLDGIYELLVRVKGAE